jgi:hypothetical protein
MVFSSNAKIAANIAKYTTIGYVGIAGIQKLLASLC